MKKIKLLVYSPLLLLVFFFPYVFAGPSHETAQAPENTTLAVKETLYTTPATTTSAVATKATSAPKAASEKRTFKNASGQEVVTYALTLIGKPYVYGGTTPEGFDCSGFTTHVFRSFDVDISRSSSTQAHDGDQIAKEDAKPGDLVIFTGTNPSDRSPGHVGIVISEPGDTISFVHSSSNGGVKISQVEGTRYDTRFLQIRRVL